MENSLCFNSKQLFGDPIIAYYSLCHFLAILIKYKIFFMNHNNINVLYILVDAWWQKLRDHLVLWG